MHQVSCEVVILSSFNPKYSIYIYILDKSEMVCKCDIGISLNNVKNIKINIISFKY